MRRPQDLKSNNLVLKLAEVGRPADARPAVGEKKPLSASGRRHGRPSRFAKVFGCVRGFVLLAAVFATAQSAAQTLSGSERSRLEAQKSALFQQMLRNPGDLDTTFSYADVSARLGDYEAAVSALDRMLLFNPNLPRVQLEIGALYFRMGSYDLARDYFVRAAAANPPPAVRERINEYMAQIEKATSRHHLSGYVFLGGQYQSDANVARITTDFVANRPGSTEQPIFKATLRQRICERFAIVQL